MYRRDVTVCLNMMDDVSLIEIDSLDLINCFTQIIFRSSRKLINNDSLVYKRWRTFEVFKSLSCVKHLRKVRWGKLDKTFREKEADYKNGRSTSNVSDVALYQYATDSVEPV